MICESHDSSLELSRLMLIEGKLVPVAVLIADKLQLGCDILLTAGYFPFDGMNDQN